MNYRFHFMAYIKARDGRLMKLRLDIEGDELIPATVEAKQEVERVLAEQGLVHAHVEAFSFVGKTQA